MLPRTTFIFGAPVNGCLSLHQRRGRQDTGPVLDHCLSGLRTEEQMHNRQRAADLTLGARSRP
jgi:hypothetical protein